MEYFIFQMNHFEDASNTVSSTLADDESCVVFLCTQNSTVNGVENSTDISATINAMKKTLITSLDNRIIFHFGYVVSFVLSCEQEFK